MNVYAEGPRELQTSGFTSDSFKSLSVLALYQLYIQGRSGMVCGPISTGGTGNQIHNFEVFNATIRGLKRRGIKIFDQTPYEYGLRKLAYAWEEAGNTVNQS